MNEPTGLLPVDQLRAEVDAGTVDTVLVAFADMRGRLRGTRMQLDRLAAHGLRAYVGTEL